MYMSAERKGYLNHVDCTVLRIIMLQNRKVEKVTKREDNSKKNGQMKILFISN